ncbi:MAG: hypothetical protein ACI9HK_003725, partial [Pirellulaceae bacterium]
SRYELADQKIAPVCNGLPCKELVKDFTGSSQL